MMTVRLIELTSHQIQTMNLGLLATSGSVILQVVYLVGGFFLSELGLAGNIGWEPPPPVVKIRQNSSFFPQLTEVRHAKITQQDHEKNRHIGGLYHHLWKG